MVDFILTLLFSFPPAPVPAKSKSPMREFPFILQTTLVIMIRDTTISSLLRFDSMESITPVHSVNLSG